MANKKINQLDIRVGGALSDLVLIGDPTTGVSYQLTAAQFCALVGIEDLKDFPAQFGNNGKYLSTDGANLIWQTITAPAWGNITGTLASQTDLQTALNAKLDESTIDGGTAGQLLSKVDGTDFNFGWIDNYTEDIRNTIKATEVIAKGQAVYISGANGTNQLASLADYTTEAKSSQTLGIAYQNFATNDIGQIITQGLLSGINTDAANAAGDPIWLGANGSLIFGLANKPYAPNHMVYLGVVTRKHAVNGEIYVKIANGFEVKELHDISAQTPSNGDVLAYNSSNGLWESKQTTALSNATNTAANLFNYYNFI